MQYIGEYSTNVHRKKRPIGNHERNKSPRLCGRDFWQAGISRHRSVWDAVLLNLFCTIIVVQSHVVTDVSSRARRA